MLKRKHRVLTSVAVAAGITAASLTGGAVLTAPAADAATYSDCFRIFGTTNGECYVSYSWWEQLWGAQNHWEFEPGMYSSAWAY